MYYIPNYIEMVHGNAFPAAPVARQLFYRDDLNIWYIYDGTAWISLLGGMIIHGNAWHAPAFATVADLLAHIAVTGAPIHGSSVLAAINTLIHRDATGRAQIVDPAVAADIDNLGARDAAVVLAVGLHAALTGAGVHGSTVAATNDRLVHRDAAGRAQIANPAVAADIDNMGSRDAAILVETLTRALADAMHAAITTPPIHGSTVAATFDKLVHRDATGRAQIVDPAVAADIDNMGARNVAIGVHSALDTGVHGAVAGQDILPAALMRANFIMVPTAAGWTEVPVGAGNSGQEPMRNWVAIPDVNAGSCLLWASSFGFNTQGIFPRFNWGKHTYFMFNYAIDKTEANLERRIQLRLAGGGVPGQLAVQGIGFEVIHLVMTGESYGTARGTVALGNYLLVPLVRQYNITIHIDPDTPAVHFHVDGSLIGSIAIGVQVPQGVATGSVYIFHSIERAGGGLANVASNYMHGKIWQEL